MRAIRLLALASLVLAVPLSCAAAQTCQGMAAFQAGRWRAGVNDQASGDFNEARTTFEYGLPKSVFGGISIEALRVNQPGSNSVGIDVNLGYQIQIGGTPFQFCPAVSWRDESFDGGTNQGAFGGALGYRLGISDWLAVVPAAGFWFIATHSHGGGVLLVSDPSAGPYGANSTLDSRASHQIFLTMGLVLKKAFTISPGLIVPSQSGLKPIYTLGVSMNWAAPARR